MISLLLMLRYGKVGFIVMYIKPWARFGPYAIGIATGYLMYKTKCKVKMNKVCLQQNLLPSTWLLLTNDTCNRSELAAGGIVQPMTDWSNGIISTAPVSVQTK